MEFTLNEIAYSIINTVRPILKDDDPIDIRDVYDWIHDQRAEFIKQQLDRNPLSINTEFMQKETVTMSIMRKFNKNPDVTAIISSAKIPSLLNRRGNDFTLQGVGANSILPFEYSILQSPQLVYSYLRCNRFNLNPTYATLSDGYLIIASNQNPMLESVRTIYVQGVFSNPGQVTGFSADTTPYPIASNLKPMLERKIIQEKYGLDIANYSDKQNDDDHKLTPNQ